MSVGTVWFLWYSVWNGTFEFCLEFAWVLLGFIWKHTHTNATTTDKHFPSSKASTLQVWATCNSQACAKCIVYVRHSLGVLAKLSCRASGMPEPCEIGGHYKQSFRGKIQGNPKETPSKTQENSTAYPKQVPISSPEETIIEIPMRIQAKLKQIPRLILSRFLAAIQRKQIMEIPRRTQSQLKNNPQLIPSRFQAAVQRNIPWKFPREFKHNSRTL